MRRTLEQRMVLGLRYGDEGTDLGYLVPNASLMRNETCEVQLSSWGGTV